MKKVDFKKKLKKINLKAIFLIVISVAMLITLGYVGYKSYLRYLDKKEGSSDQELTTIDKVTIVEFDLNPNFMLIVDENEIIKNIIFLNNSAILSLYNRDVEGRSLTTGIKMIKDIFDKENLLNGSSNLSIFVYNNTDLTIKLKSYVNDYSGTVYVLSRTGEDLLLKGDFNGLNKEQIIEQLYDRSNSNIGDLKAGLEEEDITLSEARKLYEKEYRKEAEGSAAVIFKKGFVNGKIRDYQCPKTDGVTDTTHCSYSDDDVPEYWVYFNERTGIIDNKSYLTEEEIEKYTEQLTLQCDSNNNVCINSYLVAHTDLTNKCYLESTYVATTYGPEYDNYFLECVKNLIK